jgi:hypothetical protein
MATAKSVEKIITNAGFDPLDGKAIIVRYAPANLSDQIAKFFTIDYYVLQICKDEIVLFPFQYIELKKEACLEIPLASIVSVEISNSGLNCLLTIQTETDKIELSVQQKELSDFRSSGVLSSETWAGVPFATENWHKKNYDETMDALKKLNQ